MVLIDLLFPRGGGQVRKIVVAPSVSLSFSWFRFSFPLVHAHIIPPRQHTHTQPPDCSGERLSAADGLDSAEWEQAAWSGSDEGDELDQLEVRI